MPSLYAVPCAWKGFVPIKFFLILLGPAPVFLIADFYSSTDHIKVFFLLYPSQDLEALYNGPNQCLTQFLYAQGLTQNKVQKANSVLAQVVSTRNIG